MSRLRTRAVLCEVSKLLRGSPPCGGVEQFEIGSDLQNEDVICSFISILQLLYHMADIRSCLLKIDDRTDPAFSAGQVFLRMGLRRLQGAEKLRKIQAILRIGRNEDAGEAFRKIFGLSISSRNGELLQAVQNSLFFKLAKFMHSDLTTPVEEIGEFMIAFACFGHIIVEDILAGH
jgi:hypothetical protein